MASLSQWSYKLLSNISCAINSYYLSCPGFDAKAPEMRLWRLNKAQRGVSIMPLQTAASFFSVCLSSDSCLCWGFIMLIVSCHSEVSSMDNRANHEAGGERKPVTHWSFLFVFFCGLHARCRETMKLLTGMQKYGDTHFSSVICCWQFPVWYVGASMSNEQVMC